MPAFPSNASEGHYRGHILLGVRIAWGSIKGLGWLGGGEVKQKMPSLVRAVLSGRL